MRMRAWFAAVPGMTFQVSSDPPAATGAPPTHDITRLAFGSRGRFPPEPMAGRYVAAALPSYKEHYAACYSGIMHELRKLTRKLD